MTQIRIFGKEPALIIGLTGAAINWLVTLHLGWLNAGQSSAIITLISAALIAITTRPIGPAVFLAVLSAVAALFGEYGLHWSDASVTGLGSILLAGFALLGVRPQVTPTADPVPISPINGNVR